MTAVMFDTNVFNKIVDGAYPIDKLDGRSLFITHTQLDELQKTSNEARRTLLVAKLKEIAPAVVPTESAFYDISIYGGAKYAVDDLVERLFERLKECDNTRKKRKTESNQKIDALIADTAIKNGFVLITNDECLSKLIREFGGEALTTEEFFSTL